jgi:hypothetical protein
MDKQKANKQHKRVNKQTNQQTAVIIQSETNVLFAVARKVACPALKWRTNTHTALGRRERNQQDATNLMFIIKLLSQHVSGIIMPIIRRRRVCTFAYGVLHW